MCRARSSQAQRKMQRLDGRTVETGLTTRVEKGRSGYVGRRFSGFKRGGRIFAKMECWHRGRLRDRDTEALSLMKQGEEDLLFSKIAGEREFSIK